MEALNLRSYGRNKNLNRDHMAEIELECETPRDMDTFRQTITDYFQPTGPVTLYRKCDGCAVRLGMFSSRVYINVHHR